MKQERATVSIGTDRYRTEVRAREHLLISDEPRELGGSDQGATPYELLTGALGACTAITLRMYADRKEWPLEAVRVGLVHEKVHAEDCDCETEATGRIDVISMEIHLVGPLTAEQRIRLIDIADKCPIHRSLNGQIVIKTRDATMDQADAAILGSKGGVPLP